KNSVDFGSQVSLLDPTFNDYNIDSASTSFVLTSVSDLDTVLINSSTTNKTTNRAISQTYSETSSQLALSKYTSAVWNSFSKVINEKNEEKAQYGLKKITKAIGKIRSCIKAIHTSPKRCQMFLDICKSESLKPVVPLLDCDTRFEDIYLCTYSSTVDRDNEVAINIQNDVLMFENHIDYFFKYAAKQTWKHNIERFPNLSAMAQDFLAIPASSVALEQIFSCAGRIIDDSRTLLDPDTIAAFNVPKKLVRYGR
ncbi:20327_t:CDS:2, partial [Dentiscutata erythropus]